MISIDNIRIFIIIFSKIVNSKNSMKSGHDFVMIWIDNIRVWMKSGHLFPYPAIALARLVSENLKDKKRIKSNQIAPKVNYM